MKFLKKTFAYILPAMMVLGGATACTDFIEIDPENKGSTIRQPARELGRTAVNIMMRLLNDDPDIPAETRLPVEWIGRDSIKIC